MDLAALEASLGVSFKDRGLLRLALLHASYANEHPDQVEGSNERLEFLGDAVLECVVTEELYRRQPGLSEGDMTVLRSALVSGQRLAQVARDLGLGAYLVLGIGEERSGGRERESNLAAVFEAVLGALFLDQGYRKCCQVVRRPLGVELRRLGRQGAPADAKTQLQQLLQTRGGSPPRYRTAEETGPDHDRRFTVEVCAGDQVLGTGWGRRRALAEQQAARQALVGLQERASVLSTS
ncbi:MAG: ribonuclease III [Dehalococcoidia bacterium]|nr:ribonuclease III [Dehalococcoidia bacterium]